MDEIFKYSIKTRRVPLKEDRYYKIEEKILKNDIGVIDGCIQGECNSKMISFELPRYYDRQDLSKKTPYIVFKTPDGIINKEKCVNFQYSDTKIRMSWILGKNVCSIDGLVKCNIELLGKDKVGNDYVFKTVIFSVKIKPSVFEGKENVIEVKY